MTGSVVRRSKTSWAIVLDYGRLAGRRKLKWVAFKPTEPHTNNCTAHTCSDKCKAKQQVADRLAELKGKAAAGMFVEPRKVSLGAWLEEWFTRTIAPSGKRNTVRTYRSVLNGIAKAEWLVGLPLQRVVPSHLTQYYGELAAAGLRPASVGTYHAVVRSALELAVGDGLLPGNVARARTVKRPKLSKSARSDRAKDQHWTPEEASRFLAVADREGAQTSAFFATALDTGARRGELLGLTWDRVDLQAATIRIERQLSTKDADGRPVFGTTKTGESRTVTLSPPAVARLRTHRQAQAELKMANRTVYQDNGLVFAKEAADLTTSRFKLGQPLSTDRQPGAIKDRLIKAAGVKRIVFHGTRHTFATHMLADGVPLTDVAAQTGHANVAQLANTYAHAMPHKHAEYAARRGASLFKEATR